MSVLRAGAVLALLVAVAAAQRVPLRSVESLVFEAGKMTAGRRTAPVPQMVQTNRRDIGVRSIYCRNVGWDGQNVNWECRLPDDVPARLGAFAIECEGYDYAGDPNTSRAAAASGTTCCPRPRRTRRRPRPAAPTRRYGLCSRSWRP